MIQFLKENKLIAFGCIGVIIATFMYFTFFSGGGSAGALTSGIDATPSPISQELLVTLSNLHTLKLDETLFADPAFVSLTSFSTKITPQPVGRRNPFAPLGK